MKSNCKNRFRFTQDGEDALVRAIKNSGMSIEEIHAAYCDIYDSEITLENFRAAIDKPYTVGEYRIVLKVETMMEMWLDDAKEETL